MRATRWELETLAFCFSDTRRQIADSLAEARECGLRAPTEEERERRRFDAAERLLHPDDDELRGIAYRFLAAGRVAA